MNVALQGIGRRFAGVMLCLAVMTALVQTAEISRVTPVARDGRLWVSFELRDAFTDELRAAIGSGMTTTFFYDIDLRRATPVWFDRTMAVATVSASVRYDNLTRWYQVTRTQDGRVEETSMTEDLDEVRRKMTEFQKLGVFRTTSLEPNAEYYVRVRARTRPGNFSLFGAWQRAVPSAIAKFTFIP